MATTTLVPFGLNVTPAEGVQVAPATLAAADKLVQATSDFLYPNDGRTIFMVFNSTASPTTVAFTVPSVSVGGITFSTTAPGDIVPAGKIWFFSPLSTQFNNASGQIAGTLSAFGAGCFIAAMQLG